LEEDDVEKTWRHNFLSELRESTEEPADMLTEAPIKKSMTVAIIAPTGKVFNVSGIIFF